MKQKKKLLPVLALTFFFILQFIFFYKLTSGYDFLKKHTTEPVDGVCVGMSEAKMLEINSEYPAPVKLIPTEELKQKYPTVACAFKYEKYMYLDLEGMFLYFFDENDRMIASVFSPYRDISEDEDLKYYGEILRKRFGKNLGGGYSRNDPDSDGTQREGAKSFGYSWTMKNPHSDGIFARNYRFVYYVPLNEESKPKIAYFMMRGIPELIYENPIDTVAVFDDFYAFDKAVQENEVL